MYLTSSCVSKQLKKKSKRRFFLFTGRNTNFRTSYTTRKIIEIE